jgi:eukaryotic-like serine/threonine-protein kinase
VRENGKASLWLHNVPTSSDTQVQPADDVYYNGLRFSPDGNYFYFVRSDPGNSELKFLYRAPLLGGTPQKLASDVDSNVTFSPDGQQFAFMRDDNPERGKYQLIVRPVDSDVEKVLAGGPMSQNLYGPAWSPDGKTIVCNTIQSGNGFVGMVTVDIATGKKTPFFSSNQRIFEFPAWLPDGSGVVGNYREQSTNFTRSQIGIVSYPKGIFSPVTRDTNNYYVVSVAASGRILATILSEDRWNLYVMPAADRSAQARQLTPADSGTNFTWTHDGKLIDDQENRLNLIDSATGAKSVMAMQGQASGAPWACANGRYLLYDIFDSGNGNQNVGRMNTSTSDAKQLTNERVASAPVCSYDGQWVYYISQADEQRLARVSIAGGSPQIISELPMSGTFDVSPDGKLGAFPTLEHSAGHKEMLALVATGGAKAEKLIEFERPRFGLLRFSPDGKAVVYPARENGVDNLWLQPLDGSKGHALTSFTAEHIYDFHWSFDGRQLALVRGHDDADVVLIRDAQP